MFLLKGFGIFQIVLFSGCLKSSCPKLLINTRGSRRELMSKLGVSINANHHVYHRDTDFSVFCLIIPSWTQNSWISQHGTHTQFDWFSPRLILILPPYLTRLNISWIFFVPSIRFKTKLQSNKNLLFLLPRNIKFY